MTEWWGPIISFLVAIIVCLLSALVCQNSEISKKLNLKVDEADCKEKHRLIEKEEGNLWNALDRHSHTALPDNAKVTR